MLSNLSKYVGESYLEHAESNFAEWYKFSVIELQKNKCGGPLYPSFPQQHGAYGVAKISEGARHTLASM